MQLALGGSDARTGEATDVDVQLVPVDDADTDVAYTAIEFVLTLPEGMTLEKAALTDNQFTHTLVTTPLDNRRTRILVYSDENSILAAGSTVRLTLRPDAVIKESNRIVTLNDALVATPDGEEHKVRSRAAAFGAFSRLWPSRQGMRISTSARGGRGRSCSPFQCRSPCSATWRG